MNSINVGLIGWGTIGIGVTKIFEKRSADLSRHIGAELSLKKIADTNLERERDCIIEPGRLTQDAEDILSDPGIDIIIELIGGIEPARTFILKAINNGKHVVTANKALLSIHGTEIFKQAEKMGVDVGFEASVGGGIPIIRAITEGFVSDEIEAIYGIINGTANYILTQMFEEQKGFGVVLKEAQRLGYAEFDPTYDVKGIDTAHKLAILTALAFGTNIKLEQIYTEGIENITLLDLHFASELGYCVKLLALAKTDDDGLDVRVHPTMISKDSLLASVNGVYNGIYVKSHFTGPTMFYGKGAGQLPTANSVMSNVVEIAKNILNSSTGRLTAMVNTHPKRGGLTVKPLKNIVSEFYLRFSAMDRPGVLSEISGVLGRYNISIASVIQKGRGEEEGVPIIMMTHEATEADLQNALAEIDLRPMICNKTLCIRMESLPS